MLGINSLFSSKNKPHPTNISRYPSKQYKQVLCSRPHCSDSCRRPEYNYYKYWAMFLASSTVNREELLTHIETLPEKLRISIYLRVLVGRTGAIEEVSVDQEQFNRLSNSNEELGNNTSHDMQISNDKELVSTIMRLSGYFSYEQPETAFKVYRLLEDKYRITHDLIKCIIPLLSLYGANETSVYNIMSRLIEYHGLVIQESDSTTVGDKDQSSSITVSDKDQSSSITVSDKDQSSSITVGEKDKEQTENIESTSNKSIPPTNSIPSTTIDNPDEQNSKAIENGLLDDKVMNEVWKIILDEKIDVFFNVTDLVVTLGCTYKDLISRAAEISLYVSPHKIVAVLSSKSNNHYYKDLLREDEQERKVVERKPIKQTYFDFLIIQNELIKGQENIKNELNEQLKLLEAKNEKLKDENGKLREELFKIRQKGG